MLAVIRAATESLFDVAGRPLIGRQIQWMRAIGCDRIVVHVGLADAADAVASWIEAEEVVGPDIVMVLAPEATDPKIVAQRAGMTGDVPMLVVPADTLGDGDLSLLFAHADQGVVVASGESPLQGVGAGSITLLGMGTSLRNVRGPGWLARLATEKDALTLGLAILSRAIPRSAELPIHAREREDGVFIARGAVVAEDAVLVAPVFIGACAVVESGARIGPGAIIGAGSVVSEGAIVTSARVGEHVIVGENLLVEDCLLAIDGLHPLDGDSIAIDDPLVIGSVRGGDRSLVGRAAALLLLALAPIWVLLGSIGLRAPRLSALFDVVTGRRALVGIDDTATDGASKELRLQAARAPRGAFDVSSALVDGDADVESRLRAHAWYAAQKSFAVDLRLVLGSLIR